MEGTVGDQGSTAPDEDLLAFVLRATETVRAALDRPVKSKAKINLKRYVQRQLHKCHDASCYTAPRNNRKQKTISAPPRSESSEASMAPAHSPTAFQQMPFISDAGHPNDEYVSFRAVTCNAVPTQYSGNFERAQHHTSYVSPTGYVLQCDDTCNSFAMDSVSCMDASRDISGYCTDVSDACLREHLSFCSEAGSEDAAGATVDPVFPSENCDQIVPFIETELQRYACAEGDAPNSSGSDVPETVSPLQCMYEPRDCTYASFVEAVSSVVLSPNDSNSCDLTCGAASQFLALY